jgi:Ca-activated chloride channel homolog
MTDISFARDWALLLLPIPVLALAGWWVGVGRARRKASTLTRGAGARPPYVAAVLFTLAALAAVGAAAQPRWGTIESKVPRSGADLVVVVDISRSMDARDVEPDRLQAAKTTINSVLDRLGGDRVGLVVFAGTARERFPLTTDFDAARQVVSTLQTGAVFVEGGSNASLGLETALELLGDDPDTGKVILLLTDGDDLGGDPAASAQAVQESDADLLIVGVGTVDGATIPVVDPSRGVEGPKLDADGNPIVTKLNEGFLRALAAASGGRYLGSDQAVVAGAVDGRLRALERSRIDERPTFLPIERYQVFAAIALVLLVLAALAERFARFPLRAGAAFAILAVLLGGCATETYKANEEGREALEAGNADLAIEKFLEVQVDRPDDPQVALNLAAAYSAAGRNEEAIRSARRALESNNPATRNRAYASIGHHQFALDRLTDSLDAFRRALLEDGTDDDSRHDFEVVLRLLFPPEPTPEPPPNETPPPGATPEPSGTTGPGTGSGSPTPGAGGTPTPGGPGAGGGTPTPGAGPGSPTSLSDIERQLREIDSRIDRALQETGETPTAEEAYEILRLLAEQTRITSLRDGLRGGGDPRDY